MLFSPARRVCTLGFLALMVPSRGRLSRGGLDVVEDRRKRPRCFCPHVVMDAPAGAAQGGPGPAPAVSDDFGCDADGCFLRGSGTQIEPNRRRQPAQLFFANSSLAEPAQAVFVSTSGSHGTDVAHRKSECRLQQRPIEFRIVGEYAENRAAIDAACFGQCQRKLDYPAGSKLAIQR